MIIASTQYPRWLLVGMVNAKCDEGMSQVDALQFVMEREVPLAVRGTVCEIVRQILIGLAKDAQKPRLQPETQFFRDPTQLSLFPGGIPRVARQRQRKIS